MATPTYRIDGYPLGGGKLDARLGVVLFTERQGIAATNGALSEDPALMNVPNRVGVLEIAPKTKELATGETTYVHALPADIVAYGARDATFLPETLENVTLVGTEDIGFSYDIASPPIGPLPSRITYRFFWGPPPQSAIPSDLVTFYPRAFIGAFEYSRTKHTSNVGSGTDHVVRASTDDANRTATDNVSRSGTDHSTNNSSEGSHHLIDDSTSGTAHETATGSSNATETHKSTRNHTTVDTGHGTSKTTSDETHITTNHIVTSGLNTSTGTVSSTNNSPTQKHSTQSHDVSIGFEYRLVADVPGSGTSEQLAQFRRDVNSTVDSTTTTNSSTEESRSTSTTDARNVHETTNGSGHHTNDTTSDTTHNGTATLNLTSNGTTQTTTTSTHDSTRSGTSHNDSTSTGTRNSISDSTMAANFLTNSQESSTGQTNSTSDTTSNSTSTNATTGKEILTIHIPATLHGAIVVNNGVVSFTIPPTVPPSLPSGWIAILATPYHWEAGIWVLEIHEVLLP